MRGITAIVGEDAPERFRTALSITAATAALGGRARIFCQNEAVALLRRPVPAAPRDEGHAAAGLPTLAMLLDEAMALGVTLIACQSGLALAGMTADLLDPRIRFGGMVGLLQDLGDDRLVVV